MLVYFLELNKENSWAFMFIPEFLLLFSFNWEKVGLNYANTNITKCSMMTSLSKSLVFNFTQNAFIYSMILMDQWE